MGIVAGIQVNLNKAWRHSTIVKTSTFLTVLFFHGNREIIKTVLFELGRDTSASNWSKAVNKELKITVMSYEPLSLMKLIYTWLYQLGR